jgi:hypothetical protein
MSPTGARLSACPLGALVDGLVLLLDGHEPDVARLQQRGFRDGPRVGLPPAFHESGCVFAGRFVDTLRLATSGVVIDRGGTTRVAT